MPVLTYLFRRIEKALDGSPTILVLDEAWIMLGHPVFRAKIREWLKVMRKANCAVILATQSLSDARNSGILDVLTESCPTKIFLPNGSAEDEAQRELYVGMGLNDKQLSIIRNSEPKRDYYIVSPQGRRKVQLGLKPKALAFVGASDKESSPAFVNWRLSMAVTAGLKCGCAKEAWRNRNAGGSRFPRLAIRKSA